MTTDVNEDSLAGAFTVLADFISKKMEHSLPCVVTKVSSDRTRVSVIPQIKITDKGKGVDDKFLRIYLNGKRIFAEYDPDWKLVKVEELTHLNRGMNRLRVYIRDFAGNLTRKDFTFNLK